MVIKKAYTAFFIQPEEINLDFSAPQTGHDQSAGTFSNASPDAMPLSPFSGS
jgi:hypothetical protein